MLRCLCFVLVASFAVNAVAAEDISKVNGSITVDAGKTVGDLDTVNGSIRVGSDSRAEDVATVNGSINVADGAEVVTLETVNGRISVGARVRVTKSIEAVNGGVSLGQGTEVAGGVSNVNGTIRLEGARVKGAISTVSGDIDIGADSHVQGGITVEKPSGWFNSSKPPRVVIGPRAVVEGTLEFRREVELLISDSARVGTIKGATPTRFSGERP
jgi:DUF4097 and DUF4098 domain-containing protein YvlB